MMVEPGYQKESHHQGSHFLVLCLLREVWFWLYFEYRIVDTLTLLVSEARILGEDDTYDTFSVETSHVETSCTWFLQKMLQCCNSHIGDGISRWHQWRDPPICSHFETDVAYKFICMHYQTPEYLKTHTTITISYTLAIYYITYAHLYI